MKFSFEKNILFVFICICLGVVYLGLETYKNNIKYKDTVNGIEHTQKILYASEQVLSINQDVETGSRGYLLTNNAIFLEPFNSANKHAFSNLASLRDLTKNNPVQQKRVDTLEVLTNSKITFSEKLVKTRKERGFDEAKNLIKSGKGMILMDSIRYFVNRIQTEENRLLKIRKDANEKINAAFTRTYVLQFISIFVAILISAILVFYNLNAKRNSLKENQQLLQSVIDNTPSHIYVKDLDGKYIWVNKIYADGLKTGTEDLKGKTVFDYFPTETATALREKELLAINERRTVESQDDAPVDGEIQHFLSTRYPLYKSDGTIYAIGGISTNITDIKKQSNLIHDLYDNAPSGYFSINSEGKFINANQTTLNWLGYKKEELIGKDFRDVLAEDCLEDFNKTFPLFKETGLLNDKEFTYIRKDSTLMPVLLNSSAVKDDKGNFKYSRSTIVDITERKVLERELKEVNTELESFTYSISHDLRAPLRIINGYAGILADEYDKSLDDDGRRMVKNIIENAIRMGQLIDDLLNFARLGRKEVVKQKTNMNDIVQQILEDESKNYDTSKYTITTTDLGTAYCDSSLIKQVWQNLISNAIKYSGKKMLPEIHITAYKKDGLNHYSIKDNGAGFDMKYYDKLFGVFQRLHKKAEYPGTGVGLALAQRIVAKHGGRIWAEAALNEGATFHFSLENRVG